MEEQNKRKWVRADVVKRKRAFATSAVVSIFMVCMTIAHVARLGVVDMLLYLVPLGAALLVSGILWLHSEKVRKEFESQ